MLVSLVAAVTGYVGVRGSQEIRESLKISANTAAIQALLEIKATASEIEAQTLGFELIEDEPSREEGSLTGAQKYRLIGSVEQIEKWVYRYDRATRKAKGGQSQDWTEPIRARQEAVVALAFDSLEFKERGVSGRQLLVKNDELRQAQKDLRAIIAGALQHELTAIEGHIRESDKTSEQVIRLNVLISVGALLLAVSMGALVARSIAGAITELTNMVNILGRSSAKTIGTLKVSSNDEVGQLRSAFNKMTQRLQETTVSRDALVAEVAERKLAEENLALRAEELGRSNAELAKFLSVASHDLQEPLRKVRALGDLLALKSRDSLSGESIGYLKGMQAAAARTQDLIQALRAFSRITNQTRPHVSVNLTESAQNALTDLDPMMKETGGRVDVGELPTIDADPAMMEELLRNLLSNGLKFHRSGEPPIVKIHGRVLNGQGNDDLRGLATDTFCEITVEDNGIGFDQKYLDRIFTVFQRLHTTDYYDGTGMGLAICQKIVDSLGGNITASGKPGQGASFVIRLPINQVMPTVLTVAS